MAKNQPAQIRVRGVKRSKIDADQIALAFVLMAQATLAAESDDADVVTDDKLDTDRTNGIVTERDDA